MDFQFPPPARVPIGYTGQYEGESASEDSCRRLVLPEPGDASASGAPWTIRIMAASERVAGVEDRDTVIFVTRPSGSWLGRAGSDRFRTCGTEPQAETPGMIWDQFQRRAGRVVCEGRLPSVA